MLETVVSNNDIDGLKAFLKRFDWKPPRPRVVPPQPDYANAWCGLCGQWFLSCDGEPPLDEKGAEFFHLPVGCWVCFWCVDSLNDDPGDPTPKLFQRGRA
jgi:hypothetical protein